MGSIDLTKTSCLLDEIVKHHENYRMTLVLPSLEGGRESWDKETTMSRADDVSKSLGLTDTLSKVNTCLIPPFLLSLRLQQT